MSATVYSLTGSTLANSSPIVTKCSTEKFAALLAGCSIDYGIDLLKLCDHLAYTRFGGLCNVSILYGSEFCKAAIGNMANHCWLNNNNKQVWADGAGTIALPLVFITGVLNNDNDLVLSVIGVVLGVDVEMLCSLHPEFVKIFYSSHVEGDGTKLTHYHQHFNNTTKLMIPQLHIALLNCRNIMDILRIRLPRLKLLLLLLLALLKALLKHPM